MFRALHCWVGCLSWFFSKKNMSILEKYEFHCGFSQTIVWNWGTKMKEKWGHGCQGECPPRRSPKYRISDLVIVSPGTVAIASPSHKEPDSTFIDMRPEPVILPPHSPSEWAPRHRMWQSKDVPIVKEVWKKSIDWMCFLKKHMEKAWNNLIWHENNRH